jgi:Family of unknown function (DUF6338)
MIGTIEALGVFMLAIVPGFLALRTYSFARPPFRHRGALGELGATVIVSAIAWTVLYRWRGQDLLPLVLGGQRYPTSDRLDAFAELAGLSVLVGLGLGVAGRALATVLRRLSAKVLAQLERRETTPWVARQIRARSLPAAAWDRLLTRVANAGKRVVCRIQTRSGHEVLGVLARSGYLDWEADGRGVLFDKEVIRGPAGLEPVNDSQGLFVPGDEISTLSVVLLPEAAVSSDEDG